MSETPFGRRYDIRRDFTPRVHPFLTTETGSQSLLTHDSYQYTHSSLRLGGGSLRVLLTSGDSGLTLEHSLICVTVGRFDTDR